MTLPEFDNALRILSSIDYEEVRHFMGRTDYQEFRSNPHRYFVRADDYQREQLWKVIKWRQKPELVQPASGGVGP